MEQNLICTSIEQSKRFLALGLKPETADMCWYCGQPVAAQPVDDEIPAWSLGKLIDMLPKELFQTDNYGFLQTYKRVITKNMVEYLEEPRRMACLKSFYKGNTLIENILDCIEWLINNPKYL